MIPGKFKLLTFILLASTVLTGLPAAAQVLRGAVDDDPINRVGRTASEGQRNRITPTGRRADTARPIRQTSRRRLAGRAATLRNPAVDTPAGTVPTLVQPRPPQQNFRSLERPINTAVPAAGSDDLVYQGLATPVPPRRNRPPVTDPYAPLGLRAGTLLVFPTIDTQIGFDSNPERRSGGSKSSGFSRTEAALTLRSDFARNELTAELRGNYSKFFSNSNADRPEAQGRIGLRVDYSRDTAFDFELRGRIDSEAPGTANLTGQAQGRPLTFQTGATAGITQRYNRLAVSVRATIDRQDFSDAPIGNGQTLSQNDRNLTQYGLRLRTGYEVTPGLIPFLEVLVDTRQRDQALDNAGFRRDSNSLQLRTGTSFEITRTLTGEVAAGYGLRDTSDNRLRDVRGAVAEGTLTWAISPLTTLRLRAATDFDETTQAGSAGALTRRLTGELSHALLRNLTITATGSAARSEFNGINRTDDILRASLGLEYSVTRNLVLRASYVNDKTISNTPGNSISGNTYLFGARFQY